MPAGILDHGVPCPHCYFCQSKTALSTRSLKYIFRCFNSQTHYDVLGVRSNASTEDIKAAFVKQSKLVHPDRHHGKTGTDNHDQFVRLNEAYTVLSKSSSRQEYDVTLINLRAKQRYQQYRSNESRAAAQRADIHHPDKKAGVFWDDTIWSMRDKSKDNINKGMPYYGIKGLKRVPNSYIVYVCLGLVASGVLLHFGALRHSRNMNAKILDERDRENNRLYRQSKHRAKVHGTALQLELLRSRMTEASKGVSKD